MQNNQKNQRILITGSLGQIGSELLYRLRREHGADNVVASDIRRKENIGPFENLDVTDRNSIEEVIKKYNIKVIYHLAALLSANGEKNPDLAWNVNVNGLKNILDLAKKYDINVFWPSSIAAFGSKTPRDNTKQFAPRYAETMYGITKTVGEDLCNYYSTKYGVDVRSVRFPGVISYKTKPGGGTTDYAVEIFFYAIEGKPYTCFLKKDTTLPMIYMPDALLAIDKIMKANPKNLRVRRSYNISGISFSPEELELEIKKHIPTLKVYYKPDFRQKIADSWPKTIDDRFAREDFGWSPEYNLEMMVSDMIKHLKSKRVLAPMN